MIGETVGHSMIVGIACPDKSGFKRWLAKCKCGNVRPVRESCLIKQEHTICRKCNSLKGAAKIKGTIAHNRLNDGLGGLNLLYGNYRRGSKTRGLEFTISKELFQLLTRMNCYYCGVEPKQVIKNRKGIPNGYFHNGLDRVNSKEGYVVDNIVPCCSVCNYMKQESTEQSFLNKVREIYNNLELKELT